MLRNLGIISAALLMTSGAAYAQARDAGPYVWGGDENTAVEYAAGPGGTNVIGGGFVTRTGGGDDVNHGFANDPAVAARPGRYTRFVGGGEEAFFEYRAPAVVGAARASAATGVAATTATAATHRR
jgi:hypothetical protein